MSAVAAAKLAIVVVFLIITGAFFWAWFTAGSPPSSLPTEEGSASYYPPQTSSSSEGSVEFSTTPSDSDPADEWVCDGPLPLDEVRYGSYLEDEGITTRADLEQLSSLSEVPHVGTAYGQIIASDLLLAGVPEPIVPPVAPGVAQEE